MEWKFHNKSLLTDALWFLLFFYMNYFCTWLVEQKTSNCSVCSSAYSIYHTYSLLSLNLALSHAFPFGAR